MHATHTHILTVGGALQAAARRLAAASEDPALDSQVLLAHTLGRQRAWLLAHPEAEVDAAPAEQFEAGLRRLQSGHPLPYVLGEWEFFGLKFTLTPAVLIPRPETELLVETALVWLNAHPKRRVAADVGTGSGCIPVALSFRVPDLAFMAGDISPEALAVARANVHRHGLDSQVHLVESDLMQAMHGPFDLICANLPYIPEARLPELPVTRWEPHIALGGGEDGLAFIRPFLQQAAEKLSPGGQVLAEIDASLEQPVLALAAALWPGGTALVKPDLAGLPRLLAVQA